MDIAVPGAGATVNRMEILLVRLLFWPAVVVAVFVSGYGILRERVGWLIGGAVLACPSAFYLFATPRFRWVGLLLPLCHLLGVAAVRRQHRWLAGLLLGLYAGFFCWLAVNVAQASRVYLAL